MAVDSWFIVHSAPAMNHDQNFKNLILDYPRESMCFSIHRLAHYCLDLAEMFATDRIVPVVIFLHPGTFPTQLTLGGDAHRYLAFQYLACALFQTPARA